MRASSLVLIALGAATLVWLWPRGAVEPMASTVGPTMANDAASGTTPARAPPPDAGDARPELQAWRSRQAFEADLHAFFRGPPQTGAARQAEALRLRDELERREAARELSAGEAAMLRLGLLDAIEPDPARRQAEAEAMLEDYLVAYELRMQALAAAPDPAFAEYKARERAIVAEVMAATAIPDGLSRDAYLRQRLQQERERLLGGDR